MPTPEKLDELQKHIDRETNRLKYLLMKSVFTHSTYQIPSECNKWAQRMGFFMEFIPGLQSVATPLIGIGIVSDTVMDLIGLEKFVNNSLAQDGKKFIEIIKALHEISPKAAYEHFEAFMPHMPEAAKPAIMAGMISILGRTVTDHAQLQAAMFSDSNAKIKIDEVKIATVEHELNAANPSEINMQTCCDLGAKFELLAKVLQQEITGIHSDIEGLSKEQRSILLANKEIAKYLGNIRAYYAASRREQIDRERWQGWSETFRFIGCLGEFAGNETLIKLGSIGMSGVKAIESATTLSNAFKAAHIAAATQQVQFSTLAVLASNLTSVAGMAMAVIGLIQALDNDDSGGPILQLFGLIESLRREMHERFDRLEMISLQNRELFLAAFNGVLEQLQEIRIFQERYLEGRIEAIDNRLSHLQNEMRYGFDLLHRAPLNETIGVVFGNRTLDFLSPDAFSKHRARLEGWLSDEASAKSYNGLGLIHTEGGGTPSAAMLNRALSDLDEKTLLSRLGLLAHLSRPLVSGTDFLAEEIINPAVWRIGLQPYIRLLTHASTANRDKELELRKINQIKEKLKKLSDFLTWVRRSQPLFNALVVQYHKALQEVNKVIAESLEAARLELNSKHSVAPAQNLLRLEESIAETRTRLNSTEEASWQKPIDWTATIGEVEPKPEYGYEHHILPDTCVERELEHAGRRRGIYLYHYRDEHAAKSEIHALIVHEENGKYEIINLTTLVRSDESLTRQDKGSGIIYKIANGLQLPHIPYASLSKLLPIIIKHWNAPHDYEPWLNPDAIPHGRLPDTKGWEMGKDRWQIINNQNEAVGNLTRRIDQEPMFALAKHYEGLKPRVKFYQFYYINTPLTPTPGHDMSPQHAQGQVVNLELVFKGKPTPMLRTHFFYDGRHSSGEAGIRDGADICIRLLPVHWSTERAGDDYATKVTLRTDDITDVIASLQIQEFLESLLMQARISWAQKLQAPASNLHLALEKLEAVRLQLCAFIKLMGGNVHDLDTYFPTQAKLSSLINHVQATGSLESLKDLMQLSVLHAPSEPASLPTELARLQHYLFGLAGSQSRSVPLVRQFIQPMLQRLETLTKVLSDMVFTSPPQTENLPRILEALEELRRDNASLRQENNGLRELLLQTQANTNIILGMLSQLQAQVRAMQAGHAAPAIMPATQGGSNSSSYQSPAFYRHPPHGGAGAATNIYEEEEDHQHHQLRR